MKRCSTSLIIRECKSKLQWDSTSHQSECPPPKSLQSINTGEGVEKKECSYTVGGNVNRYSHYGRWYGEFLKARNKTTIQFSQSLMSNSLQPHEPQHARPFCPSPTPRVHSNSCLSSQWCHPTISFSVIPFSSCHQPFSASEYFQMSQLFASGGQNIGVSASTSVLPMNTQDWSPLGWTCWTSLQSKGLSKVFSNTTVQKHQFFSAQLSL